MWYSRDAYQLSSCLKVFEWKIENIYKFKRAVYSKNYTKK